MTPEQIEQLIHFIHSVYSANTTSEQINLIVVFLKQVILKHLEDMVEPALWLEFNYSFDSHKKYYVIYEYDLPIMRDLKAFLNMLSSAFKGTHKIITPTRDPLFGLLTKAGILSDVRDFKYHYKIFNSTNSILTHYYYYAKKFFITILLPKAIHKIYDASLYCTHDNLIKAENLFIEQMLSLEQYRENYQRRKNLASINYDKTDSKEDDFVTFLIKKNDRLIKKVYPKLPFPRENKIDSEASENLLDYYATNPKDAVTIKNIKLLLNGVIGIKKVLNDHEEYQQAGFFQSVGWMTTFIKDLRRAYQALSQFDYEAIIAEQSNPFVEEMRKQLKKLNFVLEKLACLADHLEGELHLKEGYLLKHIEFLLARYNQMAYELRIPVDFTRQKHLYSEARMKHNENYLIEINLQLLKLKDFMRFKYSALSDIPFETIVTLKNYIAQYEDDICMSHDDLETYKNYLQTALNIHHSFKTFFLSQFEYVGNQLGLTIHYELMKTLHSRMRYLEKQQTYLEKRLEEEIQFYKKNPFCFFKSTDTKENILPILKKHMATLTTDKNSLVIACEKDMAEKKIKMEDVAPRLSNKLTLKEKEHAFFQSILKTLEEKQTIESFDEKNNLPLESALLIKEMAQVASLQRTTKPG